MTTDGSSADLSAARIEAVVDACAVVMAEAAVRDDLPDIDRVSAAFGEATCDSVAPACPDRVAELIADTAARTSTGPSEQLACAIRAAAQDLNWWTAYGTHTEPDIVELLRSYFVTSIIARPGGPEAPRRHEGVAVYVTIQGPGLFYPQHVHKAPELYYPIAGTGAWQTGDRPFEPKSPGTWVVHPTGTRHAMESLAEPMMSMAIWTADLDSVPVIVRD